MASNFELNIDVAVLEQANRKFETMVTNTAKVSANIKDINAALGGSSSAAAIVERISKAFDEISKKNVSPKFDDKNANTYVAALDKIVGFIDVISSKGTLEIFDNKALYNSSNNILSLNDSLKAAKNNIENIQKVWNNFNSEKRDKAEAEKFTGIKFPINPRTGNPFGDNTKASKVWEEEIKKQLELQMRKAIEAKAIAENSLKWAKMTESEKTAYIEKELQKQLKAEEKRITEAQRLYKSYLSQLLGLSKNMNKNEARNDDGAMTATIEKQKASFQRLYDLKTKLEQDYGVHLVQIAEEYNDKALQITADRIRKETDAKKKAEAEARNKYLSTPEGALDYAGKASTRGEMKEAQKYLQSALDVVNKDDVELIKKINNEYQRLRISIEQLSKASQNETTLLPTVRNEYSRLLRDLHKVTEAKERAAKTDAYKSGDSAAIQSYNDLLARERDLQNKIADIRRNAKGQLAEEDRKFNAEIAAQNVAETEKAERAKFEAERKRLLEIQELRRQTATRSTARANQIVDQSANVKNIAQEEQAVKKLEDARRRLNKNDADYEATLKRVNDAIERHTHNIKMATDASYREAQAKKQAQQQNTTYQGAMDYSKNVKSINDQIKAIEYLKQARANLDRSSMSKNEYEKQIKALTLELQRQQKEMDRLTGKSGNLKNGLGRLGNVAQQLKTQLTAIFGLAAIKGYIQQLVNVRKEFERQQKALEGILQSKNEADKLWGQTVKLALKSPFSVKELITYTKQLSAYRIETDKLHDTTKRLADVSAGLGVDMSRLILAYGQVRAAEYLRGTELRQFTEAGIPMLEELAKYFSELEGRTISTAKVFDMISKRMVEFEDVEAVIKRMTDEGGIFFEMQEQQSKTLYGELSNLKDAYQLMLNDIGKTHQGTMLNVIRTVRQLINNWYDLLPVITSVGIGLTTGVFGAGVASAVKGIQKLIDIIKKFGFSLKALNKIPVGGWMAIISAIVSIGAFAIQSATKVDELTAALDSLSKEIEGELKDSVYTYKKLANESKDLTKSYSEREKALNNLKRKYEDILPDEYLEVEYISKMADGYKDAEAALTSYYNEKLRKQKENKIKEEYSESIGIDVNDLADALENAEYKGQSFFEKFGLDKEHVKQAINTVIDEIERGEREIATFEQGLFDTIKKFYDIDFDSHALETDYKYVRNYIQITQSLKKQAEKIANITGLRYETKKMEDEALARKKYNDQLEKEKELVNELSSAYTNYYNKTKIKTTTEQEETDKATALSEIASEISNLYTQLGVKQVDIIPRIAEETSFVITPEIDRVSKFIHERMQKKISELSKDNPLLGNLTDEIKDSIENLDDTDFEKSSKKLIQSIAKHFNLTLNDFERIKADSKSTRESMLKDIEATITANQEMIDAFVQGMDTAKKNINVWSSEEGFADYIQQTHGITEQEAEHLKTVNEALTLLAQLLGKIATTTTKGGGKSTIDSLKEAINLVKDAHKDYKDLSKTLTHANAKELALAKNAEAFKEAVKGIPSLAGFGLDAFEFDKEGGAIKSLEKLKTLVPETTKNYKALMVAIEKAIGDLRGEAKVELKVEQDEQLINSIEEMFDGYELSLELDKLGLPKHLMADLFDVKVFDLSEIRDKINSEISKVEKTKGQEDRLEKLRELLKKVDDMEEKAAQERFKKYSKYLLKSQSEAVKIKLEEMRQLAEIESLPTSETNKSIMREGVRKETQEKLDKAYWNSFKDSDMYIRMFEDLESQSTRSINRMRKELEHYRTSLNDLDPASLKEIASRLDALDEQIAKRNPFKGLAESYKTFAEIQAKYGSEKNLEDSLNVNRGLETLQTSAVDAQQLQVEQARLALDKAIKSKQEEQIIQAQLKLSFEESLLNTLLAQLVAQKKITQEQADDLRNLQKSKKMFSGSMSDIGSDISEISNALPTLMGDLESMGVGFSDSMKDAVESVAEIGSGVGNAIQGFASGNYIQGVLGVTQAIAGVFKIGDKKKEREIKALTEKVEELGRAYEKLQKQIENAYSLDQFRAGYAQSKENLEQQIQATEDMIAAEQAKKDTDNERIREWQNNIEEYKEQLKELEDQRLQELGGFGESGIKSAADDFVDAWLTAYQETGDGLDALEDKWDEYIRNIIKKQMALRVADKVIAPITKAVDEALYDSTLTDDELAEIDKMTEEKSEEFNQLMHQLANYFGSATDALKENVELSGLTQGIQGVTEQTADQLAGLVNSIRLYSANNNATLIRIADAMEQNKPQTENPMVAQLRQLVMHTESIYDLLNNLTIDGGKSIHVKM